MYRRVFESTQLGKETTQFSPSTGRTLSEALTTLDEETLLMMKSHLIHVSVSRLQALAKAFPSVWRDTPPFWAFYRVPTLSSASLCEPLPPEQN